MQPFVFALPVDDDIDLVQEFPEGEFVTLQRHPAGFNTAHVQDVVDQAQQMLGADADLFQLIPRLGLKVRIPQRKAVQADDRVHRRADLVAHVGEERGLDGFFNLCFSFPFLHMGIDIEHDDQRADNQHDLNEEAGIQGIIDRFQLILYVFGSGSSRYCCRINTRVFHLLRIVSLDG